MLAAFSIQFFAGVDRQRNKYTFVHTHIHTLFSFEKQFKETRYTPTAGTPGSITKDKQKPAYKNTKCNDTKST